LPRLTEFSQLFESIRKIPSDYLNAAANIMAACVGYIRLEQMLKLSREDLWGRMKHYIEKKANMPFALMEMADDLSVSVSTLCKTAQKRAGKTVGQLVTAQRIEHAKSLLADENLTITDIAALVGIEDYNYFSRLFRKETGVTPKAYRQINKLNRG
jgi:AraC-like DNA-binding protein